MEEENRPIASSSSTPQQQIANEILTEAKKVEEESFTRMNQSEEQIVLVEKSCEESKTGKNDNDKPGQVDDDRDYLKDFFYFVSVMRNSDLSRSDMKNGIQQYLKKYFDSPSERSESKNEDRENLIIKLQKELEKKDQEMAKKHKASVTLEDELEKKDQEMAKKHEASVILENELSKEREQFQIQLEQLKAQLSQKLVEIQELENLNVRMKEDSATKLRDLTKELEESRRARDVLVGELTGARDNENKFQKRTSDLETKLKKANIEASKTFELQCQLSRVKEDLSSSQQLVRAKVDEINGLRDELERVKDEALRRQINFSYEYGDMKERWRLAQSELSSSWEKMQSRKNKIKEQRDEIEEKGEEIRELRDEIEEKGEEIRELRDDLEEKIEEFREAKQKIKKLNDRKLGCFRCPVCRRNGDQ